MRILHISDCYLPRLGGIEVQVADLVAMQTRAGHEVEVATATPGEAIAGVHRIVARMPFDLPVHPFGVGHLLRLMAERRPDVVHVHAGAVSPFAWMGARAAARLGLPLVVTVHSMWDPVTRAVYRALREGYGWRSWGLVGTAVSEAAARPIRRIAGRGVPVRVVSNGLDISGWRPSGDPRRAPADEPVHVVAVGRLAPRKQPVRLLRMLRAAGGRARLRVTIVGDGPARASMERYLGRHGMTGWVSMPGRYDRERIRALLGEADVFVAPAPRESFGLAALEARSAGVPVVARSQSGVADFVRPGKEGLLGRSFGELVAALVRLARDRELRERIALHNRDTEPVSCTWPAVLEGFDACYDLARSRAAGRAGRRRQGRRSTT
ncbi:GDP-mannose-dependent alpha-(1-6)-phosphatidylinositol dimannoside mannosyltransferase [Microtetraspora sp. NBRC 13810]|uniref:glycosyltransferase family 4 protein n=1 Tax=Microtetraspora sp. NBRC 13810 TaxID=3030990 RepID=UPI0024A3C8F8|nr:glycosyltransferase family 4 protein [Microtetraspora sp. NBRC 13810]GLW12374.1 GDP-mannose-dependent alpha-(1-6)-phosphatidylinositol dimannoside mannosyltransferase [Microtetraspora sp. NBRC 13810]